MNSLRLNKHSNKFLQSDFNKRIKELGHDDFLEFHILEVMLESTYEQRLKREKEWLDVWFDGGKQCYNLKNYTEVGTEISRLKSANKNKGNKWNVGRKQSAETIRKRSESSKGRVVSEETREKIRAKLLGHKYNLGQKRTPEQIENMRNAPRPKWSLESRLRASKARKGRIPWNKGKKMEKYIND